MFKKTSKKTTVALCICALTSFNAQADTTIQFEKGDKRQPSALYVKAGKVLIDNKDGNMNALYDSNNENFSVLQHNKKSYIRMDEKRMAAQMGMVENMRKQMMARMQSMPAEQRTMIESRMASMGLPSMQALDKKSTTESSEIKKTGKWHTINGFKCEVVEIYRSNKQISEACVADAKGLKMSEADFNTLRKMFDFSEKMAKKAGKIGAVMGEQHGDAGGIPVRSKNLENNSVQTIKSISTKALADDRFQIPADYSEMKMPGM
ncbi:MAG: DUF4412 domain-containing protein [Gammaproteobacteria bacterium]|nr:DUF4412 domain-containing protein [Gammaproteobacteria bacterium]